MKNTKTSNEQKQTIIIITLYKKKSQSNCVDIYNYGLVTHGAESKKSYYKFNEDVFLSFK